MIQPGPANLEIVAPLFRVRRGLKVEFRARAEQPAAALVPGSPMARNLALGHRLVRAVENGEAGSFSELARMMGVSRAWVSILVELTFLAPDLQHWIVQMPPGQSMGMAALLEVARTSDWGRQRRMGVLMKSPSGNERRESSARTITRFGHLVPCPAFKHPTCALLVGPAPLFEEKGHFT